MTATLVVERLDVVEELHLRFAEAGKPIRQLSLQRREEALHDGIDAPICQDCCGCSSGDLAARCAGAVVVDEGVVDFTRDESLQAADEVFLGQPLTGASDNVVEGRLA